tara:strand:- start:291 stop:806 length:516 start_codon:yes stop_codon:yes gene_type:complete
MHSITEINTNPIFQPPAEILEYFEYFEIDCDELEFPNLTYAFSRALPKKEEKPEEDLFEDAYEFEKITVEDIIYNMKDITATFSYECEDKELWKTYRKRSHSVMCYIKNPKRFGKAEPIIFDKLFEWFSLEEIDIMNDETEPYYYSKYNLANQLEFIRKHCWGFPNNYKLR